MKKFFSFSLILHLTLLAILLSHFHLPYIQEDNKSYVTVLLSKEPYLSPPKFKKSKKEDSLTKKIVFDKESAVSSRLQKEKLDYKEELYHFLKSKNHYPPLAAKLKHSGKVRVKIKINKSGKFEKIYLISPSNFKTLNDGTLSFLNKVAQFKPLPKNLNSKIFEVPIVYEL